MKKEVLQGKFAEVRQTIRGLRGYAREVEAFIQSTFAGQRGASAPAGSPSQPRQGPSATEGRASALCGTSFNPEPKCRAL